MSMSCRESQRWISMKVDGQGIPFAVAGRLEEHLEVCGPCAEFFSSESRRAAVLASALRAPDPSRLAASILRGFAEERGAGAPVPIPFPWSRARHCAAAVLLIAAGGWLGFQYLAPGGPGAPGVTRIIFEHDEWAADVVSDSDGSPVGRGTRQVRQLILKPAPGDGPGGRAEPEPARLDRAKTEYIRLTNYPYW